MIPYNFESVAVAVYESYARADATTTPAWHTLSRDERLRWRLMARRLASETLR